MFHNITIEGGKSVRLLTGGKYCDKDIIVNALGGATAFTVSSIDELPTDAVDGSTAIVESDSLVGEWEWNEELNITVDGYYLILNQINWGGSQYLNSMPHCGLYFVDNEIMGLLSNPPDSYNDYYECGDWFTPNRRITFYEDENDDEFKSFVKANARRLSGGYSLYTRENGEWVYKCEIA